MTVLETLRVLVALQITRRSWQLHNRSHEIGWDELCVASSVHKRHESRQSHWMLRQSKLGLSSEMSLAMINCLILSCRTAASFSLASLSLRTLSADFFYFPPGLCTTKGQWAARTPPMATCRRHPSRRATCWVGTKWTLRCSNLQRSAAAQTHKVLTLMLLWTREQMEGFGEDETKELIMASYSLLALRSVVTNLFLSLIKKLFHLTCIHAVVND